MAHRVLAFALIAFPLQFASFARVDDDSARVDDDSNSTHHRDVDGHAANSTLELARLVRDGDAKTRHLTLDTIKPGANLQYIFFGVLVACCGLNWYLREGGKPADPSSDGAPHEQSAQSQLPANTFGRPSPQSYTFLPQLRSNTLGKAYPQGSSLATPAAYPSALAKLNVGPYAQPVAQTCPSAQIPPHLGFYAQPRPVTYVRPNVPPPQQIDFQSPPGSASSW
eukprot:TRINITY_DN41826_c0_g1_i1.p1 TRINITY_DN41826_c0_g1~~TRINITY_DN41826_c0_g1_i1.p1  ORF type:complete len:224 (+),score=7.61 TRINITY_DN41826_c0_g1_i1:43-714(+)